jgi:signal transduction histidine kinase
MMRWGRSLRVRLVLVAVFVTALPLAVAGWWLTRSAERSGRQLLEMRVREAIDETARDISQRWMEQRSALLDVAAEPDVRQVLVSDARPAAVTLRRPSDARTALFSVTVRDRGRTPVHALDLGAGEAADEHVPTVPMMVPVHRSPLGESVGWVSASVPIHALFRSRQTGPGSVAAIVGVFDAATGAPLVALPFDKPTEGQPVFDWGGERWLAVRRTLAEPPLEIIGATPLTPFERPLRDAARRGLWVLLAVAAGGIALAAASTTGMTRSLHRLASAAEGVAAGALDRRVDDRGADEVARVARSFNHMTASLQQTLQSLAEQRALARIGEFAATLAHEVRNPLTAIRVDLQVAEENLPEDARALRPLRRALAEIDRLDRGVGAALLATRAARGGSAPIDVTIPLAAAVAVAEQSSQRPLAITVSTGATGMLVDGDAGALEQLFLNLLLNAVEAVREAGEVRVACEPAGERVVVKVLDTGSGLSETVARQAFEPLFTTRAGGTGLGLTIAARLAHAHGGSVTLQPSPAGGAVAIVDLPKAAEPL